MLPAFLQVSTMNLNATSAHSRTAVRVLLTLGGSIRNLQNHYHSLLLLLMLRPKLASVSFACSMHDAANSPCRRRELQLLHAACGSGGYLQH
jgi:hypothetical protein